MANHTLLPKQNGAKARYCMYIISSKGIQLVLPSNWKEKFTEKRWTRLFRTQFSGGCSNGVNTLRWTRQPPEKQLHATLLL